MACSLSYTLSGVTGACSTVSGGSFSILINGSAPDYRIEWLNPASFGTVILGAGISAYTVTNLTAGTYSFNIIDSCLDPANTTTTASVYISSGLCTSITGVTNTVCNLDNGALSAYTQYDYGSNLYYLYHTTLGYITSGTTNLPSGRSFDGLAAGTYYMKVVDNGGCTATTNSVIIKESTNLDFDFYVVNDSGCNTTSGKVYINNINGSPPYTYLWSNGATTSSITELESGSYSVTVSDNTGCVVVKTAEVLKVPTVGQAGMYVTQPACFGNNGSVTVVVSGGTAPYYYSGSNGVISVEFANVFEFNNLPGGQFNYFVQDAALCNFTGGVTLQTPSSFNIVSITTTNSTCNNSQGSLTVNVTSGTPPYVFKLTDSNGDEVSISSTLNNYSFTNLSSDVYTLSIKDGGSCEYVNQYTITNEVLFDITTEVTGTTCGLNNGVVKITVDGGDGPFLYEVGGESQLTNETVAIFNNLPTNSYPITVTDTTLLCAQYDTTYITPSVGVDFIANSQNPSGSNNGAIQIFIVQGQPPFTLEWSDNVNGQTGMVVTNLSAGTYTIKVTDDNGCIKNQTIILEGSSCSVSYEVYNLCESDFSNTGELLEKGPLLMLNEGFVDLTIGDTNCVLNEAIFEAFTSVSGVTASTRFYTATTLTDVPSDSLVATTVRNMLLNYDGIGNVTINTNTNKVTISTDCESDVALIDASIFVNIIIHYDISCVACAT